MLGSEEANLFIYLFCSGWERKSVRPASNSPMPKHPQSHLVAGLQTSDKYAHCCQILWGWESIAAIDNVLRCCETNHSRSLSPPMPGPAKPHGQWLEGRLGRVVNCNSLLARCALFRVKSASVLFSYQSSVNYEHKCVCFKPQIIATKAISLWHWITSTKHFRYICVVNYLSRINYNGHSSHSVLSLPWEQPLFNLVFF